MASSRPKPKTRDEARYLRTLNARVPDYMVAEVHRAAQVRSRIERKPISADLIVERALASYLWLDPDEMCAGALLRPTEPIPAEPTVVTTPVGVPVVKPSRFGTLLRQLRRRKQCPITQLAATLNLPAHYLYEIERGVRTPLTEERIRQVAQLLQIEPDELLSAARQ